MWSNRAVYIGSIALGLLLIFYIFIYQDYLDGGYVSINEEPKISDSIDKIIALLDLLVIEYEEALKGGSPKEKEYRASIDIINRVIELYKEIQQELKSIDSSKTQMIMDQLLELKDLIYNKEPVDKITAIVDSIAENLNSFR